MAWTIRIEKPAEQELAKLDHQSKRQIIKKLKWFREHFDETVRFVLHSSWDEYWKLRVGNWRVMYTVHHKEHLIRIWHVDRRDRIYKRRN